jgi:hypothetical protein
MHKADPLYLGLRRSCAAVGVMRRTAGIIARSPLRDELEAIFGALPDQ